LQRLAVGTPQAAWAKANPGKASYASYAGGTPSHFLGHQLAERLKVDMTQDKCAMLELLARTEMESVDELPFPSSLA
jgi:hypothetical protein